MVQLELIKKIKEKHSKESKLIKRNYSTKILSQ